MEITNTGKVIGIDLGTTNSVVSVFKESGEIEFLENLNGDLLTPSFVYVGDGNKFVVGSKAKDKMEEDPTRVLSSYKRYINEGKPIKEIDGTPYDAVTCTSIALKYIKKGAEEALNSKVEGAVITVPAYFDSNAKAFTAKAAEKAGLNVIAIITEPVASAFTYLKENKMDKDSEVVLVYDIGGGTFDVSITNITKSGLANVIGVSGDHYLGGDDFDKAIAVFLEKNSLSKYSLTDVQREILVRKSEDLKKKIMADYKSGKEFEVELKDVVGSKKSVIAKMTVEDYKKVTDMLVNNTIEITSELLSENGLTTSDIDKILLVGGSSRLMNVREKLDELFDNRFDLTDSNYEYVVEPDLSISYGASVYVGMISDRTTQNITDVLSKDLGLADNNGKMLVILNRGSAFPCRGSKMVTNPLDDQNILTIQIYEGNNPLAERNHKVGELQINCPKGLKAHELDILVYYTINSKGILNVKISGDHKEEISFDLKYSTLDNSEVKAEIDVNDVEFTDSIEEANDNESDEADKDENKEEVRETGNRNENNPGSGLLWG